MVAFQENATNAENTRVSNSLDTRHGDEHDGDAEDSVRGQRAADIKPAAYSLPTLAVKMEAALIMGVSIGPGSSGGSAQKSVGTAIFNAVVNGLEERDKAVQAVIDHLDASSADLRAMRDNLDASDGGNAGRIAAFEKSLEQNERLKQIALADPEGVAAKLALFRLGYPKLSEDELLGLLVRDLGRTLAELLGTSGG